MGNNQDAQAQYYIYDNVFDGTVDLNGLNSSSQVYNNLVRTTSSPTGFIGGSKIWNMSFWNNIVLSSGKPITAYVDKGDSFTPSGPQAPLHYMDYNVYDGAPSYDFGVYTSIHNVFNLSQMKARGFERHSRVVASTLNLFQDRTSYVLKPQWTTWGRNRDPIGPRFPIVRILEAGRYGPQTLKSGSSPIITQQPQSQTASVGGTATFSVQINGSGLCYQWQGSTDGGAKWHNIRGADSAVLSLPWVSMALNGALLRCLSSSAGGSVWSDTATLTINAAAQITR